MLHHKVYKILTVMAL